MINPAYVLGHSEFELGRLARQERLVRPATREYLLTAGIAPGMRVLDVGSGAGAVAFIAADLVGPSGQVVGTDLAPTAIAAATAGATKRRLGNVSFHQGNPAEMIFERLFDAVVGRYVLLFQPDPADMLRRLAKLVRPGGVLVFHEPDWSFARSDPPAPLYDRCHRWVVDIFERVGTSTNMSAKLHRAFIGAGLPPPVMRMRATIGERRHRSGLAAGRGGTRHRSGTHYEEKAVASLAEMGCETLVERVIEDVAANGSMIVGRAEIGAWVRV